MMARPPVMPRLLASTTVFAIALPAGLALATAPALAASAPLPAPQEEVLRVDRDTRRIYSAGIEAIGDERWQAARDAMQNAIERLPTESTLTDIFTSTRRNNPTPYLPYYYLGRALFGIGDCAPARDAWTTSFETGALDEARREEALRLDAKCSTLLTSRQEAASAIAAAQGAADLLETFKQDARLAAVWQSNRALGADEVRGGRALDFALKEVGRADDTGERGKDPEVAIDERARAARAAVEDAERARNIFDDIAAEARQTLFRMDQQEDTGAAVAAAGADDPIAGDPGDPDDPAATGAGEPETTPSRPPEEPPASAAGEAGRDPERVETSTTVGGGAAGEPPATVPVPDPLDLVPDNLFTGARHFFAGRYAEADRILAAAEYLEDMPAQRQVYLLRAAARLALYLAGGEEDDRLYTQALEDARACLAISSTAPDAGYFSPKLIELFRAAQRGGRP